MVFIFETFFQIYSHKKNVKRLVFYVVAVVLSRLDVQYLMRSC